MTSQRPNSQLASIQILRGVAASLVVLHHFAHAIETYSKQESWIVTSGLAHWGRPVLICSS
jgi:peptidoglycan/LPS O-acetylase OafA/YrhL